MRHIDRRDFAALTGGAKPPVLLVDMDGETEEVALPFKMVVCDLCDGGGRHVNPSIDAHGLTREDFDDDPDFAEDYFAGVYDVTCSQCKGRNVVPVVDESRLTPEQLAAWKLQQENQYAADCERAAELRMGY